MRFLARHPEISQLQRAFGMHRGKIERFALDMKAEGMPLPNPAVDGANDFPLLMRHPHPGMAFLRANFTFLNNSGTFPG